MKKSTKYLIVAIIAIIAVALIGLNVLSNMATEVTTTEFFKKAGVYFVDFKIEEASEKAESPNTENNGGGVEEMAEAFENGNTENAIADGVITKETSDAGNTYYLTVGGEKKKIVYFGYEDGFVIVEGSEIKRIEVSLYNLSGYDAEKNGRLIYKTSYSRTETDTKILNALSSISANGVIVDYSDPNEGAFFSSLIVPLLTIGFGIFILIIFTRQAQGGGKGAMDFGKTKARVNHNVPVRFSDVAGAEEEKRELQEVVEFLKNPKKFTALGAKIPKGVLLVGPPGTGKTLVAKAVAGEANVPFFSISGSDFVEMFVGVGASRVRDLFNTAKKAMPCIVFIDEIDAVGRQRGAGLGGGNDEREQTLNQLLVEMDGFESNEGIIIMAATNRADVLDPALLRPGRFDRQVYIHLPDVRGREAILKVHSRNKPLAQDVNFKILARMTSGFSGADLANLLNEAAILAARANRKAITNEDLYEAIEKIMMGPKKTSKLVTESDKRITAYHEAGHAILAKLLPNCDVVHEVTIIPRGNAGGYTLTRPENDNQYTSRNQLLDDLVMTMGGRAAEEIIIKDYTTGAYGDIKQVSKIARRMVSEFGMSENVGPVSYGGDDQVFIGRDYQTRTSYSEAMAKKIDDEVESLIKTAHEKAVAMLSSNREILDKMARLLIERETIYSEEINMLMRGESLEAIGEYMDKNAERQRLDPFGVGKNNN